MALERCPHCKQRVRIRNFKIHEKHCPEIRRQKKREFNSRVTQSLQYRQDKLKQFPNESVPENLEQMPDNAFNEILSRLETKYKNLSESVEKKKEILKAHLKDLEKQSADKKQAKKDLKAKQKIEEENRLAQIEKEQSKNDKLTEKREKLQKTFEKVEPEKKDEIEEMVKEIKEGEELLSKPKKKAKKK